MWTTAKNHIREFLFARLTNAAKIFMLLLYVDVVFVEKSTIFFRKCNLLSRKDYFARKREMKQNMSYNIEKEKTGGKKV